jgi:PPOX class probable F420-dependent enzyme
MPRSTLDDTDRKILQGKNFAHVSTLRDDGTIQTVPVWVDVDNGHVVLNSAKGRAWPTNLEKNGKITITVQNLENPYQYVTITGHTDEETTDGAEAHIDRLAKKYKGVDRYEGHSPDAQRVIFRIAPDRVYRNR